MNKQARRADTEQSDREYIAAKRRDNITARALGAYMGRRPRSWWERFTDWLTAVDNDLWGSVVVVALGFVASGVIVAIAYAIGGVSGCR